jgi:hypothetical protein
MLIYLMNVLIQYIVVNMQAHHIIMVGMEVIFVDIEMIMVLQLVMEQVHAL